MWNWNKLIRKPLDIKWSHWILNATPPPSQQRPKTWKQTIFHLYRDSTNNNKKAKKNYQFVFSAFIDVVIVLLLFVCFCALCASLCIVSNMTLLCAVYINSLALSIYLRWARFSSKSNRERAIEHGKNCLSIPWEKKISFDWTVSMICFCSRCHKIHVISIVQLQQFFVWFLFRSDRMISHCFEQ